MVLGCQGNHSVWGTWDGNTLINVIEDYGVVPGECNNPTAQPAPVQPAPAQPTVRCDEDVTYCHGDAKIRKHDGYPDGNNCVYDNK